ncbi:hypothetical protein [Natronolimnobius baerhuensis]|uniref:Uncharacterized protein n=1 Tax=Natronolimnobius baerhuensis TaxID=253108 RepID=A0A202EB09_9EURY|nr:hypothetical protein [Natronolimnobius baerhuensis]OVE85463.1 hypothetical protein B2G88_01140 [Natronolimnobius baerhuensis]
MSSQTQTRSSQARTQHRSTTVSETQSSPADSASDLLEVEASDQELARTAAITLGIWLMLTLAAVGILMLTGDAISAVVV